MCLLRASSQVMTPDAFLPRHMSYLLGVQVCFPDQVVLNIAEKQTVLAFTVNVVTDTLRVIELSLGEVTLDVAYLTVANLLDKGVSVRVKD